MLDIGLCQEIFCVLVVFRLWFRWSDPVNGGSKFGQEHGFFHGFLIHSKDGNLTVAIEGSIARGTVAHTLSEIGVFALEGWRHTSHGSRGEDQRSCLKGSIGRVDSLTILDTVAFFDIDHKDLSTVIVCAVINRLLSHLIQQLCTSHGLVHTGVVGNVGRDRQRSDGWILVQDDCLEVRAGGVQCTGAPSRTSTDNDNVAFNDFHFFHHAQGRGGRSTTGRYRPSSFLLTLSLCSSTCSSIVSAGVQGAKSGCARNEG
mmetsp:Transcript_3554/g.5960  ORF Transcript_3554/g.5960 Transcript_3554/m.5960 type:complete len:258 (-) Transcript_3554:200-973(-)